MFDGFQIEQRVFDAEAVIGEGVTLLLVERGMLRAWLAPDEPVRVAETDVLVVAGDEPARLSAGRGGAHAIVFRVQGEWLARALTLTGLEPGSAPLRAATLRAGTHPARRAALFLRELLARPGVTTPEGQLAQCAAVLGLLAIAVAAREDAPCTAPRPRRSAARVALAEALRTLAREPRDGLRLPQLAARLGLSERQASRLVHERLGRSLGEHVTELRIARAQQLLAESDLSVIDVAAEAGFGSLGHFNQVFRERCGGTPSAFRATALQRFEASGGGLAQPAEPAGGASVREEAGGRARLTSRRSSRFTIASIQADSETLPS